MVGETATHSPWTTSAILYLGQSHSQLVTIWDMQISARFALSSQDSQDWVGNILGKQFPGVANFFFHILFSRFGGIKALGSNMGFWGIQQEIFLYLYLYFIGPSPLLLISVSYFEIACFIIPQVLSFHWMTLPKSASWDIFRISSGQTHYKDKSRGACAFLSAGCAAALCCSGTHIHLCQHRPEGKQKWTKSWAQSSL